MSRLPRVRPRQVVSALQRSGFEVVRVRGSHYQLLNPSDGHRVTVPHHSGDISRATLNSIVQ
jgi:predicted RNA binding protein YcfA (HicA-like mRNA interferase family)